MPFEIRDGTGSTSTAKVTSNNQLSVASDAMPRSGRACFDGFLHGFTTGPIALTTTGSYNGLLYLLNLSSLSIYVWQLSLMATISARWQLIKNPTAGTLISAGTAISATNMNFANTFTLDATLKKGANGSTITDGTSFYYGGKPAYDNASLLGDTPILIGQSDALAISCRPSASCDAFVSMLVSQEDLDL